MAAKATMTTETTTERDESFEAKRKGSPSAFLTGVEIMNGNLKVRIRILIVVSLMSYTNKIMETQHMQVKIGRHPRGSFEW